MHLVILFQHLFRKDLLDFQRRSKFFILIDNSFLVCSRKKRLRFFLLRVQIFVCDALMLFF